MNRRMVLAGTATLSLSTLAGCLGLRAPSRRQHVPSLVVTVQNDRPTATSVTVTVHETTDFESGSSGGRTDTTQYRLGPNVGRTTRHTLSADRAYHVVVEGADWQTEGRVDAASGCSRYVVRTRLTNDEVATDIEGC